MTDQLQDETAWAEQPRPRFKLRKSRKAAIAATIAVAAGVFTYLRGGLFEVLHVPPVRDVSTPAAQQGYTLVDVVRSNDDGGFARTVSQPPDMSYGDEPGIVRPSPVTDAVAGLWILPPDFGFPSYDLRHKPGQDATALDRPYYAAAGVHVTGKTPSGEVFAMPWQYFPDLRRPLLFVPIPGGYSDSLRYLDITVTDSKMRVARWRIDRLPAAQHLLPGSPDVADRFQSGNAAVTAEAVRFHSTYPYDSRIAIRLYPRLVRPDKDWNLLVDPPLPEWAPFDRPRHEGIYTFALTEADAQKNGLSGEAPQVDEIVNPFVYGDRFVRVSCRLQQFDRIQESVTFRGLPLTRLHFDSDRGNVPEYAIALKSAQTQTTASGITIRLPAQDPKTQSDCQFLGPENIVTALIEVTPEDLLIGKGVQTLSLPLSPLQHAYGKSPSVSTKIEAPHIVTDSGPSTDEADGFRRTRVYVLGEQPTFDGKTEKPVEHSMPSTIDLTFQIDQRIDLREIPFTLTLPVRNATSSDWTTKPWTAVQQ